MYITHHGAHTGARVPIGSQYKILYITLYTWTWVGDAAAAAAAVYPRETRLPPSDSNTHTYNNINRACRFVKPREDHRR